MREQPGTIGFQLGSSFADFLDPIGVEQRGRGGTIGQRESVSRRPTVVGQIGLQPVVGDEQGLAALLGTISIAHSFRAQRMVDRRLHVALHVKVEEPVEEPHAPAELAVGYPYILTAVAGLQMFDDAARLAHWLPIVDQHRELAEGPQPLELRVIVLVFRNLSKFELSPVRVERDENLPGVGREWMAIERKHHQTPRRMSSRRAISASLGSAPAKLPTLMGPAGS